MRWSHPEKDRDREDYLHQPLCTSSPPLRLLLLELNSTYIQLGEKGWYIIPSNLTNWYAHYRSDPSWNDVWKANQKLWATLLFKTLRWDCWAEDSLQHNCLPSWSNLLALFFCSQTREIKAPCEKKKFSYFGQTTWRLGYRDLCIQDVPKPLECK